MKKDKYRTFGRDIKIHPKDLNFSVTAPQIDGTQKKVRDKFLIIFWIAFYLTIFAILIHNSFSYLDPDLGWHLKVGEQIVKEKAVPNFEYYDYTLTGQTWVDHEWLSNVIIYWLYIKFGYLFLNILYASLIIVTLIILNIFTQKYIPPGKSGIFFIIIFQVLGTIASLPHFGVRIQELSILNLLLLLFIIKHYNKKQNIKVLFLIFPLFYLWSSMHGGFLIGIFIMFFWLFIKWIEIILEKFKYFSFINYENKLTLKQLSVFLLFALGGIIATLITPYGFKLYGFLNTYRNDFYLKQIQEWLPFYYLPINYWQILFESILISIILLILYYSLKKKSYKIPLWQIALSLFFLIMALKSKRHFPLLFISSFPLMINFLSFLFNDSKSNFSNKKEWKYFAIVKIYLIIGLLAISATKLLETKIVNDPFASFKNSYPYDAVNFLKNHPEYNNLKFFSEYNWGGYLIWMMPEKKLFIDGRLPHQPFAGRTLLEEYMEFNNEERVEIKISQYNIEQFLIYNKPRHIKLNWFEKYFLYFNEEVINKFEYNLKNYLDNSPSWKVVFTNNISNIYVKQSPL